MRDVADAGFICLLVFVQADPVNQNLAPRWTPHTGQRGNQRCLSRSGGARYDYQLTLADI